MQFGVHSAFGSADQAVPLIVGPLFRPQTGRRAARLQIGRVDHHCLGNCCFGGQTLHHTGKDALVPAPLQTVVEGLWRAILLGCVAPSQAIAIDEDNTAQHPLVIDPRLAVALGKEGFQTRHLCIRQPEKVAH